MDPQAWDPSKPVFDHVHLRVSSLEDSRRFYLRVLEPLGLPVIADTARSVQWPGFTVSTDREPTVGAHVAFVAGSREQVIRFHQAGVLAGFRDNGAPGYRDYAPGWYAAYLLDPDGNNIEAVFHDDPDEPGI